MASRQNESGPVTRPAFLAIPSGARECPTGYFASVAEVSVWAPSVKVNS